MDDRSEAKLRGPVQNCRTELVFYNTTSNESSLRESNRSWTGERYLLDGRLAERSHGNPDDSEGRTDYSYDDQGRLQKQSCWQNAQSCGSTAYYYDPQSRLATVKRKTVEGKETITETYSYDAQARKSRTRYAGQWSLYTPLGVTMGIDIGDDSGMMVMGSTSVTTVYDEQGREQETVAHDAEHQPISKFVRKYDQQSRLVEVTMLSTSQKTNYPKGMLETLASAPEVEQEEFRKVMNQLFGEGAVLSRTSFRYDDQGRIVERTGGFGPFLSDRETKTYNEHGDESSVISYSEAQEFSLGPEGDLIKVEPQKRIEPVENHFVYTYGEHGNWVEKRLLSRSGPSPVEQLQSVEKRELTYW